MSASRLPRFCAVGRDDVRRASRGRRRRRRSVWYSVPRGASVAPEPSPARIVERHGFVDAARRRRAARCSRAPLGRVHELDRLRDVVHGTGCATAASSPAARSASPASGPSSGAERLTRGSAPTMTSRPPTVVCLALLWATTVSREDVAVVGDRAPPARVERADRRRRRSRSRRRPRARASRRRSRSPGSRSCEELDRRARRRRPPRSSRRANASSARAVGLGREAADDGRHRVHRAPADERRQLVAELLDAQRALDDVGVRRREREDAAAARRSRARRTGRGASRGSAGSCRTRAACAAASCARLTSTPIAASIALIDVICVVRRADAADARRDERRLVEPAPDDHRLEEPRGLDDVQADVA